MTSFEGSPHREKFTDSVSREWHPVEGLARTITADGAERSVLCDELFQKNMRSHVVELFFDCARDIGFTEEQSIEMQDSLSKCSDKEIFGALSLPNEIRETWLESTLTKIEKGQLTPHEAMLSLVSLGTKYGFGIGFHTSPYDIRPDEKGKWVIKGAEKDHRDDDQTKAYYSNKYRHLFKTKHPKFIYVVRTSPEDKTDGNWSRASSLSVVMRLPFEEVHQYVETAVRRIEAEDKKNLQGE